MREFKYEVTPGGWTCDAGCCSDSWIDIDIYHDSTSLYELTEVRQFCGADDEDIEPFVREYIKSYLEDLGDENEEYVLTLL